MLPIAIPILHSSGAWIASTAAGGYIAGTLSTTWVGAFIAGNAGFLSAIGVTSAAGVYAAIGGTLSTAGTALGSGLSAVGLSGLAKGLGLMPAAPATFLGLTFASWAIVTYSVLLFLASRFIYLFARQKLEMINAERSKGGLEKTTWLNIVNEIRDYERHAMIDILAKLDEECEDVVYERGSEDIEFKGVKFYVRDLKYVVEKDGTERIVKSSLIPFRRVVVYTVKRGKAL